MPRILVVGKDPSALARTIRATRNMSFDAGVVEELEG